MRCLLSILVLIAACGDDSGSAGGPDARVIDGLPGAADGAGGDGPRADAGTPASCGGLAQPSCEATPGCAPSCTSLCDCTCPGPPGGHEGCGCEACQPSCFRYDECVSTFGFTACGEAFCDDAEDVCVR